MNTDKKREKLIDLFYLAVILLACLKVTYGITNLLDIVFADEASYLSRGLGFDAGFLFKDGFVYYLWYKFLSFFVQDPIYLYCYNYVVLLWSNAVLMYVLFRKLGRAGFSSAVFSIFFLIASINIFTWPFVTRFVVTVILLIVILVLMVKRNLYKYLILGAGLFILSYVRPEFVLSLVLYTLAALAVLGYRFYRSGEKIYIYGLSAALVLCVFTVFIAAPTAGNRDMVAFGQHYINNLREWEPGNRKAWRGGKWEAVMNERFNNPKSMAEALANNPGEMLKHVWTNVRRIPYRVLYAHYPFPQTRYSHRVKILLKWLIIGLYLASLARFSRWVYGRYKTGKQAGGFLSALGADEGIFHFLLFTLAVPSLAVMTAIYPREHYIVIFLALLWLWLVKHLPTRELWKWISSRTAKAGKAAIAAAPIVILLLLFFIPWRVSGTHGVMPGTFGNICSHLKRLQEIKRVRVAADVHVLCSPARQWLTRRPFPMFANAGSDYIYTFHSPGMEFLKRPGKFTAEKGINMILVDKRLSLPRRLYEDPWYKSLLEDPALNGWTRFDFPYCSEYLLVKNEILAAEETR